MRRWTGPLLALALVAAVVGAPFHGNFRDSLTGQLRLLPDRMGAPLDSLLLSVHGEPYTVMAVIRDRTPETSVILVPDTPADDPYHRKVWLAWFLHPRMLVQPADVAASGRRPDYELITPNFRGSAQDSLVVPGVMLVPRSEAARRAFEGTP